MVTVSPSGPPGLFKGENAACCSGHGSSAQEDGCGLSQAAGPARHVVLCGLQQPSGEAKCFASSHFFHEPSVHFSSVGAGMVWGGGFFSSSSSGIEFGRSRTGKGSSGGRKKGVV
jgi:hypothetical protein